MAGESTPASRAGFSWNSVFLALLVIFILFGLGTKLYLSANMSLNSDTVGVGLESMELWKHQNYLLTGYHVTAADTFFFTELLPFQLLPQIATGYNPLALKLVTFNIFCISIVLLSGIVYLATKNMSASLLFSALAANIPPEGYLAFAMPTTHNATILFGGLIMLLLLLLVRRIDGEKNAAEKRRKKSTASGKLPWPETVLIVVLSFLAMFSDTIVAVWFIAPFALAYLLIYRGRSRNINTVLIAVAVVSAVAYVIKTYFVRDWYRQILGTRNTGDIFTVNLPLFFKALASLLNQGLYRAMENIGSVGFLDVLSLIAFVGLLLYALRYALKDGGNRLIYVTLFLSIALMFAAFMVSDYARDMGGARYLTFTALAVLLFIALTYDSADRYFKAFVVALLILSTLATVLYISSTAFSPNASEYDLIDYLKGKNLSYGYGTYDNSNVITYLSGEDVQIRTAKFYTNGLQPDWWLSCDRWYINPPDQCFIIADNRTMTPQAQSVMDELAVSLNVTQTLHYRQYDIYPFKWSQTPAAKIQK